MDTAGRYLKQPSEFSEIIEKKVRDMGAEVHMGRSVYSLLEIARGEDYYEMLWNMMRILTVLGVGNQDIRDLLMRVQDNPSDIRRYFYALIIGIIGATGAAAEEGRGQ